MTYNVFGGTLNVAVSVYSSLVVVIIIEKGPCAGAVPTARILPAPQSNTNHNPNPNPNPITSRLCTDPGKV